MLLPHAQVGGADGNQQTLERKLQSLLGAVESHWPSFEPNFSRVSNRLAGVVTASHGVAPPMDGSHSVLNSSTEFLREAAPVVTRPHDMNTKYISIDRATKGKKVMNLPKMDQSYIGGKGGHGSSDGGW